MGTLEGLPECWLALIRLGGVPNAETTDVEVLDELAVTGVRVLGRGAVDIGRDCRTNRLYCIRGAAIINSRLGYVRAVSSAKFLALAYCS